MTEETLDSLTRVRLVTLRLARLSRPQAELILNAFGVDKASSLQEKDHEFFIAEAEKEIRLIENNKTKEPNLRDLFAIAALQSPFAMHWTFGPGHHGGPPVDLCADRAYRIADAMLARRKT